MSDPPSFISHKSADVLTDAPINLRMWFSDAELPSNTLRTRAKSTRASRVAGVRLDRLGGVSRRTSVAQPARGADRRGAGPPGSTSGRAVPVAGRSGEAPVTRAPSGGNVNGHLTDGAARGRRGRRQRPRADASREDRGDEPTARQGDERTARDITTKTARRAESADRRIELSFDAIWSAGKRREGRTHLALH